MRHILLPAIRPTITLMMIMTVIWSFLSFDFVYVLTQGGPAFSSEVLSTLSYRYAFYDFTIGPAAAVAVVIRRVRAHGDGLLCPRAAAGAAPMIQTLDRGTLTIAYALLGLGAAIALFPLALMAISALKTSAEIVANPLALPQAPQWINFVHAWTDADMARTLRNSAEVTGLTILLICSTGSMAAYALARRKVRGTVWFSTYFLATTTLPIQLYLFPLYFGFAKLNLIDSVVATSLIYTGGLQPVLDLPAAHLLPRDPQGHRGGRHHGRRETLAGVPPRAAPHRFARHPHDRGDRGAEHLERVPDFHDVPAEPARPDGHRALLHARRAVQQRLGGRSWPRPCSSSRPWSCSSC